MGCPTRSVKRFVSYARVRRPGAFALAPMLLVAVLSAFTSLGARGAEEAAIAAIEDSPGGLAELSRFEIFLEGVMAAQFRDYDLAGMTFVLVRDGRQVLSRGFGVANLETGAPVDPAMTLFRPGSVSKLFTWTAVMQLVEAGRLDLDAPVATYVDQFELPEAFGVPLTLTHLMTHAPGLEDGAAGFLFADEVEDLVPLADSLAAHIPEQIWAPGTFSAYNNWATALAGLVVANVSGMSFEDYVSANIFEPLGMAQATFEEPLPAGLAPHMAQGYWNEHGGIAPMDFEFIKNFGPAGALSASADAMGRFILAHINGGGLGQARILEAATVERMHGALFAHDERVAAMAHGFYEIRRNGERFIGHGGDTIAFHSQLVLKPESGFGFFLSFNTPEGARARTAVVDAILDYFYPGDGGRAPELPAAPLAGSAERIAKVAGAYRMNRRAFTKLEGVIALAGDLVVAPGIAGEITIAGNLGGRFVEVEPYRFRKRGRQETLVFQTGENGAVERALVGSLPIMVADRLPFWATASNHQLVIVLALLSALFVLINACRPRTGPALAGPARWARLSQIAAAASFLAFALGFAVVFSGTSMNEMIFDFPPPGTGVLLLLPMLGALCTALCLGLLVPVWRAEACNGWQRLRYSWVCLIFSVLVAVLAYWNLLGWRY
ncbi:MAG: serine hydrolase domain-containing protein [Pseudomonadota bacterium]